MAKKAAGKNKIPMRQCMGCREMKSKKELIRILRTDKGEIVLDATGRRNGRGAYLCHDFKCLERAKKSKALERSLQVEIPEEIYERLEGELKAIESK